MDENMNFEGFDSVWARVTEQSGADLVPMEPQPEQYEEKICLVKTPKCSCAVRFIPKF